ncbi:MAG: type II toxin-antitoxin system RelE/ParE family toxin [Deltaproteobacteria bacterium]|nr:type II toxin-antitoxin system RelE/ParE family toxin [Deltaproteobacteria bacterium]
MGKYKILISRTAEKAINKIPKSCLTKILAAISALSFDPFPDGHRKLKGYDDIYRIRVQNYRIIYEVFTKEIIIKILKVGHRKDVYRN